MKSFIPPIFPPSEPDMEKIDKFISCFNLHLGKNIHQLHTDMSDLPRLSSAEFELVKQQAAKDGYLLTRIQQNDVVFQPIIYKLEYVGTQPVK